MLKISLQKLPESHFGRSFWLLLAGAGGPKAGNPWFEQLYTEKLEDFRQSSINLSTLRGEFEGDKDFTRIFTGKSAPRRRHLAPHGWRRQPQARKSMI